MLIYFSRADPNHVNGPYQWFDVNFNPKYPDWQYTYDSYGNITSTTKGDTTTFIKSSSSYTSDGNYLSTVTNPSNNSVLYNYDLKKGTLSSFRDAKLTTTNYLYDSNLDRLTKVYKTVDGQGINVYEAVLK